MSLVAIFCALIRRLPTCYDVQARPIGFPGLLLAGVANRGQENWVYINVFSGGDVLGTRELSSLLTNMGGMTLQPEFLRPATAKEMVSRCFITSLRFADASTSSVPSHLSQHPHLRPHGRRPSSK